jgi:transcriptional regulator with XRE-family HTH domain
MIEGWKIREWREKAGMTVKELAEASAMRPAYLEAIEAERVGRVHTRTYLKIADALGVSLDQLASDPDTLVASPSLSTLPVFQARLYGASLLSVVVLGVLTLTVTILGVSFYICWLLLRWVVGLPLEEVLNKLPSSL